MPQLMRFSRGYLAVLMGCALQVACMDKSAGSAQDTASEDSPTADGGSGDATRGTDTNIVGDSTPPLDDVADDAEVGDTQTPAPCSRGPTAGLLLYYDFEHRLTDQSGHGRDGVMDGTTTYIASPAGTGLAFDGASTLTVTDGRILGPTTGRGRTMTFWADFGTSGEGEVMTQYRNYEPAQSSMLIGYSHLNEYFQIAGMGTDSLNYTVHGLSGWHRWAVIFMPSPTPSQFYFDGVLVASQPIALPDNESPYDTVLGALPGTEGQFLSGALDEVRIYDRALSLKDLATLRDCTADSTGG